MEFRRLIVDLSEQNSEYFTLIAAPSLRSRQTDFICVNTRNFGVKSPKISATDEEEYLELVFIYVMLIGTRQPSPSKCLMYEISEATIYCNFFYTFYFTKTAKYHKLKCQFYIILDECNEYQLNIKYTNADRNLTNVWSCCRAQIAKKSNTVLHGQNNFTNIPKGTSDTHFNVDV